jgi:hypothetical protein
MAPDPDPIVDKLNDVILAVAKVEAKIETMANSISNNNTTLVNAISNNNTTLVTTLTSYIKSNYDAKAAAEASKAVADANRKWLWGTAIGVIVLAASYVIHWFGLM